MSEEAKAGTGTATGTGGAVTLPPGGISGVDTESSDLDLMSRLIGEKNQPKQEAAEGDESDGEGGDDADTGDDGDNAAADTGDEESSTDGEAGEGDEDGGGGAESEYNAALLEAAQELGFESLEALSEKQLETLKKLVKVSAGDDEGEGEDDEEALTEYERSLLAEDEEEEVATGKKDGKDGKEDKPVDAPPADEPATANQFFASLLDGKFKLAYKNDADFYAKLNEAAEKKDVETYEVLQNQRFVERGMKFLLPALQLLVDRKLDAFADIITPALSEYSNVSSQRRVASARDKAIGELESLTVKSGAKPYSGIKQFLTPDQPDKKVVINGTSVPSSPWTRVLKANPEILNIRVPGKDGKTDPTATFISQYKAAMKLSKATSTSTPSPSPVVKKVAEKMASAGAKAGQRQAQRNAGGKLNSNSSGGTGKQAGQDKKNWAKEYAEIGNVTGAASWIGS